MKTKALAWLGALTVLDVICLVIAVMIKWYAGIISMAMVLIILFTVLYVLFAEPKQKPEKAMSGLEYERWCANRLAESGKYLKVVVTPPTGDFGADIVAVDAAKRTWVIQCKHYHSKLGNSPIQEVVSAKAHYGAKCAAVVTNSTFTEKAKQLARENGVKLYEHIDGDSPRKPKWKNYSVEEMMFYDDMF